MTNIKYVLKGNVEHQVEPESRRRTSVWTWEDRGGYQARLVTTMTNVKCALTCNGEHQAGPGRQQRISSTPAKIVTSTSIHEVADSNKQILVPGRIVQGER